MNPLLYDLSAGVNAFADGLERAVQQLDESGEDTVYVVLEDPSGVERLTLVVHSDGSYGLSFPPPPDYTAAEMDASDDEDEDEGEEFPDAGR